METKKSISKDDYLKLVGLFVLAHYHNKTVRDIEVAAAEIIKEELDDYGGYGHLSDTIYDIDVTSPDNMLRKMSITVRKN